MTAKEWAKTDKPMTDGKWLSREKRILSDLAAAEERAEKAEERVAALEEAALHESYSLSWEDKYWDAVKCYEDAAQELHECQSEQDRLRERLAEARWLVLNATVLDEKDGRILANGDWPERRDAWLKGWEK